MANLIREISKQQLTLVPDTSSNFAADSKQSDSELIIKVVNASPHFASFQVELSTDGADPDSRTKWYRVEPQVCAKKPPGDSTEFRVIINKAPIPAYDTRVPIQIKVFSLEVETLFDTRTIDLIIKKPDSPLKVYLPIKDLKVYPGDKLDIPVLIYNLSPKFTQVKLTLDEVDPDWFIEKEVVRIVPVDAGVSQEVIFCCSPPKQSQTVSRLYDFIVRASDQSQNSVSFPGKISLLPYGVVEFNCLQPQQSIPYQKRKGKNKGKFVKYQFDFTNKSNLEKVIQLQVIELTSSQRKEQQPPIFLQTLTLKPGEEKTAFWEPKKKRPWLGWKREFRFEAIPQLENADTESPKDGIYASPNLQVLDLDVWPIVPLWLQLLAVLGFGFWIWTLPPRSRHEAPVTSVRIISNNTTVVSGSSDRTVRRWDVNASPWMVKSRRLAYREEIANRQETNQAVRVIRPIPNQEARIAVGLDNGTIQLWKVSSDQSPRYDTIYRGNDRVFDLDFTSDSRYLFSVHGSGFVRRWNLSLNQKKAIQETRLKDSGAISALSVMDLGVNRSLVAITGQYNLFALWDWRNGKVYSLQYDWRQGRNPENQSSKSPSLTPIVGRLDYINTLSFASQGSMLAMGDNRGFITLWDTQKLNQCILNAASKLEPEQSPRQRSNRRLNQSSNQQLGLFDQKLTCYDAQINQWSATENAQPIRSVALSANGCYLVSGGDDGRVVLWFLKDKFSPQPTSLALQQFSNSAVRTVDIKQPSDKVVLIASDAPNHQVKLYRQEVNSETTCVSRKPN